MGLQNGPIAKLSTTNYYLTLKTKGTRDSTHAIHACTQNTLAMWELLRLKSINQTLGFTRKYTPVPKQSFSIDLWLSTGAQKVPNLTLQSVVFNCTIQRKSTIVRIINLPKT